MVKPVEDARAFASYGSHDRHARAAFRGARWTKLFASGRVMP